MYSTDTLTLVPCFSRRTSRVEGSLSSRDTMEEDTGAFRWSSRRQRGGD